MKDKLGPLPVWAWALLAGGGIGAFLLYRKRKGKAAEPEAIPQLASTVPATEGAGGGGGASAGALEAAEAKSSAIQSILESEIGFLHEQITSSPRAQPGVLGNGIQEVIEARNALAELGLIPGSPQGNSVASSSEKGQQSPLKEATGKAGAAFPLTSSRGKYRDTIFKGHAGHEYAHPVQGGVGPKHSIILLGGPSKITHARQGSHLPARTVTPWEAAHGIVPSVQAAGHVVIGHRTTAAAPSFRVGTYRGKRAHIHSHAVPGGVGPGHNIVIV